MRLYDIHLPSKRYRDTTRNSISDVGDRAFAVALKLNVYFFKHHALAVWVNLYRNCLLFVYRPISNDVI